MDLLTELIQALDKYNSTQNDPCKLSVVLTTTLKALEEAETELTALHAAGVDNWSGYTDAFDVLTE